MLMLLAARDAPRRPDVQQPHLAFHVFGGECLGFIFQLRQTECGRRLIEQGRRKLLWITPESEGEEGDEQAEEEAGGLLGTSAGLIVSGAVRSLRAARA